MHPNNTFEVEGDCLVITNTSGNEIRTALYSYTEPDVSDYEGTYRPGFTDDNGQKFTNKALVQTTQPDEQSVVYFNQPNENGCRYLYTPNGAYANLELTPG